MKRRIRLTESDLHRVIKESVRKILNETNEMTEEYGWVIGRLNSGHIIESYRGVPNFFNSKEDALNDGLKHLAKHRDNFSGNQGVYLQLYKVEYINDYPHAVDLYEPIATNEFKEYIVIYYLDNGEKKTRHVKW